MSRRVFFPVFLLTLLVGAAQVYAQTLPVTSPHIVSAKILQASITNGAGRRGFTAADPRTAQTVKSVFSKVRALDTAAYGRMSKFLGRATPWVNATVFVASGVQIYGVLGGGVKHVFDPDDYETPGTMHGVDGRVHRWWVSGGSLYANSVVQALVADYATRTTFQTVRGINITAQEPVTDPANSCDPNRYSVRGITSINSNGSYSYGPVRQIYCRLMAPDNCPDGTIYNQSNGQCLTDMVPAHFVPLPASETTYATFDDWYQAQPQSVKDSLVHDQVIAELANQAWRHAAEDPAYVGIPWDANNPVLPSDVPSTMTKPAVKDLLGTNPAEWPAPADDPNTISAPEGATVVDLGDDPGTPEPTLEEPPTDLLQPLVDALAPLQNVSISTASVSCPTWHDSFSIGGRTFAINLEEHCDFIEPYYSLIFGVMLALWAVSAFWIVLEA